MVGINTQGSGRWLVDADARGPSVIEPGIIVIAGDREAQAVGETTGTVIDPPVRWSTFMSSPAWWVS